MTAPALRTYANAGTEVSGDNCNTFQQTCNIFDDLRAFIGTTGVQVFSRGRAAINDGYGGTFYWNGSSATADDNLDVIAPTGQATGRWIRLDTLTGEFAGLPADQTGGDVADSVPFLDVSESGALNTVLVSNFFKNSLATMTAKTPVVSTDTVAIGDSAASGAIKRTTLSDVVALVTGSAAVWPKGSIYGLTLARASTTTYTVATGQATNEDGGTSYDLNFTSAFTKSLSAWVAGTGNGSLDTGGIGATTWYHVHLIRKDSDGSLDILLSLSATGPTMPAGYTARRRLGSIKTDGSSQVIAFTQEADEFLWDVATIDVDAANPGTSAVTRTLNVPTGLKVRAMFSAGWFVSTTAGMIYISSLDASDQAVQAFATASLTLPVSGGNDGAQNGWSFTSMDGPVRTNTSGQVRSRVSASAAGDRLGIVTRGWMDRRGQG